MPDRKEGFVRRGRGIQPPDEGMADQYRRNAHHDCVVFDHRIQLAMIEEVQIACEKQNYRLHAAATDSSHLHALVSWSSERTWMNVRSGIKSSLTRRLNHTITRRGHWFSRNASRKRVRDRDHLDYLIQEYLPKHVGAQWYQDPDRAT